MRQMPCIWLMLLIIIYTYLYCSSPSRVANTAEQMVLCPRHRPGLLLCHGSTCTVLQVQEAFTDEYIAYMLHYCVYYTGAVAFSIMKTMALYDIIWRASDE